MSIRSKKLAGAAALAAAMALGSASAEAGLFLDYNVIAGGTASGTGKSVTGSAGQTAVVQITATVTGANAANDDGIQSVRLAISPSGAAPVTLSSIATSVFNGSGSVLTPSAAVLRAQITDPAPIAYRLNPTLNGTQVLGTFTVTLAGSNGQTATLANSFNLSATTANGGPIYVVDGNAVFPEANGGAGQTQGAPITITIGTGPTFVKGDFNGDGVGDFGDLEGGLQLLDESAPYSAYLAANANNYIPFYGVPATEAIITQQGDFNLDGVFDFGDLEGYLTFLDNGGSGLTYGISVVPEPTSMALVAGALTLVSRRRRR